MQAVILDAEECTANIQTVPVPNPGPLDVLVRVNAISLNPIDPLYVSHPLGSSGRTVGSDFAGTIVKLGTNVSTLSGLQIEDRVAGFLQGACSVNVRPGAFAEYLVVPWDLVWKIPSSVSFERAAGVSLVALTAAQAIWCRLGVDAPFACDQEAILDELGTKQ